MLIGPNSFSPVRLPGKCRPSLQCHYGSGLNMLECDFLSGLPQRLWRLCHPGDLLVRTKTQTNKQGNKIIEVKQI